MKWPFARHSDTPPTSTAEPQRVEVTARNGNGNHDGGGDNGSDLVVAPSRREWMALPPLHVAGGRQISLTSAAREFTQGLASRQNLVQSPRLEHVRQLDAPSGSFRGVLAPATDHGAGTVPELQEPSALPAIEHRQVSALKPEPGPHDAGDQHAAHQHAAHQHDGLSPVEQLLAIGESGLPPTALHSADTASGNEASDEPWDGDGTPRRRLGLADSRRQGLGPAYHGPLPEAMRAERERVIAEAVPNEVRSAMRDVLGVDVGDRLVHRGPAVSSEAQAMGAQAFTRGGEVFIADEVGPLDQPRGRSTLAHELTHAAQQQVHGTVPDERSEHGRALEAHAQRVEQYVRGDAGATKPPPEMLHARPQQPDAGDAELASTRKMMRDLVDSGFARPDGSGGIVFTMPPSSMTATGGTQRLAGSTPQAQPGEAARQENWSAGSVFGNTLAQGLGSDLLGIAGSMFGFSDEFMGEQRHELANANREFQRQQTRQAFTELRMEHLRTAELQRVNAEQVELNRPQLDSLDEETVHNIEQRVHDEVERRMDALRRQTFAALGELNTNRAANQPAIEEIPDETYDVAFHRMFDDPDSNEVPTDDELKTMLMRPAPTGGGRPSAGAGGASTPHPSGGAGTPPGGHSTTGPAAHATGTGAGSGGPHGSPTGGPTGAHGAGTGAGAGPGTGTGHGTGAEAAGHHDEPWRTADTMGGR
ncbi:MAG TPA: DUF4157 domain-containing protein, partial [Ilumatobacteraceae bacterium]|nr:DUF4157 domain-containing protein [Ilumatobacteraceae bacterium]